MVVRITDMSVEQIQFQRFASLAGTQTRGIAWLLNSPCEDFEHQSQAFIFAEQEEREHRTL